MKKHGGERAGAGRKKKEKTVVIRIPESLLEQVREMIKLNSVVESQVERFNRLTNFTYSENEYLDFSNRFNDVISTLSISANEVDLLFLRLIEHEDPSVLFNFRKMRRFCEDL